MIKKILGDRSVMIKTSIVLLMVLFLPELAMAATGEIAMEGAAFWPRNEVVRQVIM